MMMMMMNHGWRTAFANPSRPFSQQLRFVAFQESWKVASQCWPPPNSLYCSGRMVQQFHQPVLMFLLERKFLDLTLPDLYYYHHQVDRHAAARFPNNQDLPTRNEDPSPSPCWCYGRPWNNTPEASWITPEGFTYFKHMMNLTTQINGLTKWQLNL